MMGMISSIEQQKGRVTVFVDGAARFVMTESEFERLPVSKGDELDEVEYADRLSAAQVSRAYNAALGMLARRDVASGGMRASLERKGFEGGAIEAVIDRLLEQRLIDDMRFAHRFVEMCEKNAYGRYAIRQKLRAKGVGDAQIDAALEGIDEDNQRTSARALAEKLSRRYQGQPARAARAKLSQALARRGFDWDVVSEAVEGLFEDEAF